MLHQVHAACHSGFHVQRSASKHIPAAVDISCNSLVAYFPESLSQLIRHESMRLQYSVIRSLHSIDMSHEYDSFSCSALTAGRCRFHDCDDTASFYRIVFGLNEKQIFRVLPEITPIAHLFSDVFGNGLLTSVAADYAPDADQFLRQCLLLGKTVKKPVHSTAP